MINFDTYKEIQEMLKMGVKKCKICEILNISQMQMARYGQLPEDLFLKTLQSRTDYTFDTYRDYIISILRVTPDMNDRKHNLGKETNDGGRKTQCLMNPIS